MPTIKLSTFRESPPKYERWHTCELCGSTRYNRVQFQFTSGSTEPTDGETLTGNTSGDTGVVESTVLYTGSWSNGDAQGHVILSSLTGVDDDDRTWGAEDEEINGSTGGNSMMTMTDYGFQKTFGLTYPMSFLIERDGKYYCKNHYNFRWYMHDRDEEVIDLDDDEVRHARD